MKRTLGAVGAALLLATSCAGPGADEGTLQREALPAETFSTPAPTPQALPVRTETQPAPTPQRPDVIVRSPGGLQDSVEGALLGLVPEGAGVVYRSGVVTVQGQDLEVAAVPPSGFRSFAPPKTVAADGVWAALERGEFTTSHYSAERLGLALGERYEVSGNGTAQTLRLGAKATTNVPGADVVVNEEVGDTFSLKDETMLLSSRDGNVTDLAAKVREVVGRSAAVDLLTPPEAGPTAFLTGNDAAKAFGAFSYRYYSDGTIVPDAGWVRENIVTEEVPILGKVTCHRLMIPQLRGALKEIQALGLAETINPEEYAGCYVPRFIERNPERPISLHTWGIAVDMNVPGNLRGTSGEFDRRSVAVFKKWGFNWGGDWNYTDPMHFELGAVLS